ncbi:PEGA domain-containing protein [Deltaproteobacteria bacterium TL4]
MLILTRFILILWIYCLWNIPLYAVETEKPTAAVAPLVSLGGISKPQEQIIFNSMLTEVSKYFALVSQEQYNAALQNIYEEVDEQECTVDQCIRKIQDSLQIESLFFLQMIREGADTQLSLTLVELEQRRVKSDYCVNCDTNTLNKHIAQLVKQLVKEQNGERVKDPDDQKSGTVFISSTPAGADIYLDGELLDQKTDVLLNQIPMGSHTILLRNEKQSKEHTFEVKLNQLIRLNLILEESQATLLVSSQPFNADVSLDGKLLGKTPLEFKTTLGKHQLELKLKNYITDSREIEIEFGKINKYSIVLEDAAKFRGFLTVTSTPADALIQIKGGAHIKSKLKPYQLPLSSLELPIGLYSLDLSKKGYQTMTRDINIADKNTTQISVQLEPLPAQLDLKLSRTDGIENADGRFRVILDGALKEEFVGNITSQSEARETTFNLPHGRHELEVVHTSGKYKPSKTTLFLEKGETYTQRFDLKTNETYDQHQAWKTKFYGVLAGTLLTGVLTQLEIHALQETKQEIKKQREQINVATSHAQYQKKYNEINQSLKKANEQQQNIQTGLVVFLGMSGWASWLWLDAPPPPMPITWNVELSPKEEWSLSYQQRW